MCTCETSQVMLASVPGVYFLGVLLFSVHFSLSHMSQNNPERYVKLIIKIKSLAYRNLHLIMRFFSF